MKRGPLGPPRAAKMDAGTGGTAVGGTEGGIVENDEITGGIRGVIVTIGVIVIDEVGAWGLVAPPDARRVMRARRQHPQQLPPPGAVMQRPNLGFLNPSAAVCFVVTIHFVCVCVCVFV